MRPHVRRARHGHVDVRYRADTGFEHRCDTCAEWWPLTLEHWQPKNGLARCRSCWRAYHAEWERSRNQEAAIKAAKRQANAVGYAVNRPARLASGRAWKAANRERVAAYNKAYREARRQDVAA